MDIQSGDFDSSPCNSGQAGGVDEVHKCYNNRKAKYGIVVTLLLLLIAAFIAIPLGVIHLNSDNTGEWNNIHCNILCLNLLILIIKALVGQCTSLPTAVKLVRQSVSNISNISYHGLCNLYFAGKTTEGTTDITKSKSTAQRALHSKVSRFTIQLLLCHNLI